MQNCIPFEEKYHIDPKYHPFHNYLLNCNDICASILKEVDRKKMCAFKLDFTSEADKKEFFSLNTSEVDWQQWLMSHGYSSQMYKFYSAHTFYSLVADFCNYIFESIVCASKMKVAVAYALLRKPFKDTLAYIEWLYIDHQDFIDKLINDPPKSLMIKPDDAKRRILEISEKTGLEAFYEFRYDGESTSSLEHIWNNANHIITTHSKYSSTAQGNLNFIFSDEANLREFSDYYYFIVPSILNYATDLICEMFEQFSNMNDETRKNNHIIRVLRHAQLQDNSSVQKIIDICNEQRYEISCPVCNSFVPITLDYVESILDGQYSCKCGWHFYTGIYMFDWEK